MAAAGKFKKQLDDDKRFLSDLREKLTRQMDRLKAEEKTLRQLLRNSALASARHSASVHHKQNTSDVAHIDEEQWINQTPLELSQEIQIQRGEISQSTQVRETQSCSTEPHSQMDAARNVLQSILQEELGPDWMQDVTS